MNRKSGFLAKIILVFISLATIYISSGYGFERKQPSVIPPHPFFYSPLYPKSSPSFCLIQYDQAPAKFYWNGFGKGDGIAVYMDPAKCGFDSTYPFKLTNVHLYLYDPGSFIWPADIKVNIREVRPPEDSIRSPGGLLFYKTFSIPSDSGYDTLNPQDPMNLTLDTVFCVSSPFFLEVIYTGTATSNYASLVMSDSTDRPDSNENWLVLDQKYARWDTAWFPVPGRAIMRVTGYPQAVDCHNILCWYWTPKTIKAPSGMPDFDQYQFGSDTVALCAPTTVANDLVWLNAIPSITNPDSLIRLLSYYFYTSPSDSGGTLVDSIKAGLDSLFANYGLNLYDTIIHNPTYDAMSDSLKKSANIVLLIGLWQKINDTWYRIGGHYVSMSGVCYYDSLVALSDPALNNTEAGAKGRILPPHDSHPTDHILHNTKGFVSHDVYIADTLSVGPYARAWRLKDYDEGILPWSSQFEGQNFQTEQLAYKRSYEATENIYAVVEYAIMILEKPSYVAEEERETPQSFELFQCFPNPFNSMTGIQYTVGGRQIKTVDSSQSTVDSPFHAAQGKAVGGSQFMVHRPIRTTLKIYNILGQLVMTLVDEEKEPGHYNTIWDGKNDQGRPLSSGIYFYQLKAGEFSQTKRMVLLK